MSLGLETIEMDEKGNVLPEYEETHKRNLAWLQLCYDAGETGNAAFRNGCIATDN